MTSAVSGPGRASAPLAYRLYGQAHRLGKRLLRRGDARRTPSLIQMYDSSDVRDLALDQKPAHSAPQPLINDLVVEDPASLVTSEVFYGENACRGLRGGRPVHPRFAPASWEASSLWSEMLENAKVPPGWRNSGFYLVGYIRKSSDWCLSSWIWTSAAVARYYASIGRVDELIGIADSFVREQLPCGGWLVRFDYADGGVLPIIAPNDSAYIAANALLSAHAATGNQAYLTAAKRCAAWIRETMRPDGLVYFGQNGLTGDWITDRNIVDVGFTAGLFCELYRVTHERSYLEFAERFVNAYVRVFYDREYGAFWTSVDRNDCPRGGHFARGQAWALEGLMAYHRVTGDIGIRELIDDVVNRLIKGQRASGAWPYNLSNPLMGEDCKGTPVLAKTLLDWYAVSGVQTVRDSARRAVDWCERHTIHDSGCPGAICAYSVEGAVVHSPYSETALVYASAYASEAYAQLERGL